MASAQNVFLTYAISAYKRRIQQAAGTGDGFKEVKQIRISGPEVPPVVPDGGATVMLLGAALSVLGIARSYLKS
jgi:hypothetical protein